MTDKNKKQCFVYRVPGHSRTSSLPSEKKKKRGSATQLVAACGIVVAS
jgi:hypothetical protein